jgi:ribose 5-phosphate isomerase B
MTTIALGTDHAGYALKEAVKAYLDHEGYDVVDKGAHEYDEHDDYPDFIIPAAEYVRDHDCLGIVFGGSGEGEAMAANKVRGVRATAYYGGDDRIIELSKEHNDANVLSIGARFVDEDDAIRIIEHWLGTTFSGASRHERRIKKLRAYEERR